MYFENWNGTMAYGPIHRWIELVSKERVGIALGGGAAASKPPGSRGLRVVSRKKIHKHSF